MVVTHFCIIGYLHQQIVQQNQNISLQIYHKVVTLCHAFINGAPTNPDQGINCKKIRVHCTKDDEDKQFSCFVGQRMNGLYDDLLLSAQIRFSMKANLHSKNPDGHRSYLEDLGDLIDKLDDAEDNKDKYLNLYLEERSQEPANAAPAIPLSTTSNSLNSISALYAVQDIPSIIIPNTSNKRPISGHFQTISDCLIYSDSLPSTPSTSASSESTRNSCTERPFLQLQLSNIESDDIILTPFGYKVMDDIKETNTGNIYVATCVSAADPNRKEHNKWSHLTSPRMEKHVAIKKVDKKRIISDDQFMHNTVSKEAMILHYLTVINSPPRNNICNFVEFIETDTDYFLVQEFGDLMTLRMFTNWAHQYMKEGKLQKKEWRIFVKYFFWQLVVNMYWMHYDMSCFHLGLNMDNILVKNAHFVKNSGNTKVRIDSRGLMIKICDFSAAEVFAFDKEAIKCKCVKPKSSMEFIHKSPKYVNGETFDAIKADTWSLGVLLCTMLTGEAPFMAHDNNEEGYAALQDNKFAAYLKVNGFSPYISRQAVKFMKHLLIIDEDERFNTEEILKYDWFENYYTQSEAIINKKSKTQKLKHLRQQKQMEDFPLYCSDV